MDGTLDDAWQAIEVDGPGLVHLVPIGDARDHYFSQSCPCHVKLEMHARRGECGHIQGVGRLYIHFAWDGRE